MEREETEEKESVRKTEKERHEMKYKVGDKVRVRRDLEGNKGYGGWYTSEGMVKMRGEIVTIRGVGSSAYELEENDLMWTDEMLEGLVEDELTAEEAIRIQAEMCSVPCRKCPISKERGAYECRTFRAEHPDKVVEILKQRKKEHEKKEVETEFTWCVLIIEADTHTLKHEEKVGTDFKSIDAKKAEILKKYCSEHDGKYYAISERRCVVKE